MEHYSEEDACLLAMQLAAGSVLPMVLKSAVELELFDLIQKADQPNISASELAARLPTSNPDAPSMLDRMLRLLAAHSLLTCSSSDGGERRYSLGPLGKFFTKNKDGVSLGPASLLAQNKVVIESWHHLKDAVMEGDAPFKRAHGMSLFEYAAKDPGLNKIFNNTMAHSTILCKKLIEMYSGFDGLKSLVDVGGGTGATLSMIISKYPSIKGINFDMPHVIRDAPSYPGIEHVAGDMFAGVPKGDAIFLKWITHSWSDANCLKILKNCKEALPESGKVIIADYVLPHIPKGGPTAFGFQVDALMQVYTLEARERTEKEFQALAKEAGFKEFRNVCSAFTICIMEFYK